MSRTHVGKGRTETLASVVEDFETFVAVAECGSQTRAASWLTSQRGRQTEQQAVQSSLERVEAYFDQKLFIGSAAGVELNDHGRNVLPELKTAVDALRSAKSAVRTQGMIRIGFSPVVRGLLAPALKHCSSSFKLREAMTKDYRRLLVQREIDVAVGFDLDVDQHTFGSEQVAQQELVLVVPRDITVNPAAIPDALANLRYCYIAERLHKTMYASCCTWLAEHGLPLPGLSPDDAPEACTTAGELLALVGTGTWFCFLPALCVPTDDPSVKLHRLTADRVSFEAELYAFYVRSTRARIEPLLAALKQASEDIGAPVSTSQTRKVR